MDQSAPTDFGFMIDHMTTKDYGGEGKGRAVDVGEKKVRKRSENGTLKQLFFWNHEDFIIRS